MKRALKRDYWMTQEFQRQLFEDFLQNRCSWKFLNIHRKTPVLLCRSLWALGPATLLKRDSSTVVFQWILRKFLRTAFPIEQLWWLLLELRDDYSSSVGYGHPGKYSYEIPHKYLSERVNLSGKIISIKHNH